MRKPVEDQLHSDRAADQCLCFCHIGSTIPGISKCEKLSLDTIFCCCTARFVLDLVGYSSDIGLALLGLLPPPMFVSLFL